MLKPWFGAAKASLLLNDLTLTRLVKRYAIPLLRRGVRHGGRGGLQSENAALSC